MNKKKPSSGAGEFPVDFAAQRAPGKTGVVPRLCQALYGIVLIAAFWVVAPGPQTLFAKKKEPPSRTISGQVLDKAENPIPDAAVQLTDMQTGKKIAIYSQEDGSYQFAGLRLDHDYEVQASFKNVSSDVRRVSSVEPRNRVVINLKIPPDNP